MCVISELDSLEIAIIEEIRNGNPIPLFTKSGVLKVVCAGLESKGCVKIVLTYDGPVWSVI